MCLIVIKIANAVQACMFNIHTCLLQQDLKQLLYPSCCKSVDCLMQQHRLATYGLYLSDGMATHELHLSISW